MGVAVVRAALPVTPVVTHLPLTGQLTSSKTAALPAPGPATLSTVHLLPPQASAAGAAVLAVPWSPTAMQRTAEVQETPSSSASVSPLGPPHLVTVQVLPFHTSAKASESVPVLLVVPMPVTAQLRAETQ